MEKRLVAGYGVTHTLEETARLMGISREGVRQIEKRALAKLQKALSAIYGTDKIDDIFENFCCR